MSTSNYFAFLSHYTVKICNCSHFYAESSITQKSKQKLLGVLLHKSRFYRASTPTEETHRYIQGMVVSHTKNMQLSHRRC